MTNTNGKLLTERCITFTWHPWDHKLAQHTHPLHILATLRNTKRHPWKYHTVSGRNKDYKTTHRLPWSCSFSKREAGPWERQNRRPDLIEQPPIQYFTFAQAFSLSQNKVKTTAIFSMEFGKRHYRAASICQITINSTNLSKNINHFLWLKDC